MSTRVQFKEIIDSFGDLLSIMFDQRSHRAGSKILRVEPLHHWPQLGLMLEQSATPRAGRV
jgi:hypothetical protein